MNEFQTKQIKTWSEQRDKILLDIQTGQTELDKININIARASESLSEISTRHDKIKEEMAEEIKNLKRDRNLVRHHVHIATRDLKKKTALIESNN